MFVGFIVSINRTHKTKFAVQSFPIAVDFKIKISSNLLSRLIVNMIFIAQKPYGLNRRLGDWYSQSYR